jgi:hypothetical protein
MISRPVVITIAVAAVLVHAALVVAYIIFPAYFDHGEAAVVIQSWWLLQGARIYTDPSSADYFVAAYGPLAYVADAAGLWLWGGSVAASKIGPALASLGAVGVMGRSVLRREGLEACAWTVLLTEAYVLAAAPFSFLARPDPWAMLLVAIGIAAVNRCQGWRTLVLGLCAGLLFSLKFFLVLALLPTVAAELVRCERRTRLVLRLAAGGAIGAILPWLLIGQSPFAYLATLRVMIGPRHVLPELIILNCAWAAALLAPAALAGLAAAGRGSRAELADRTYLITLAAVLALIIYPASLIGSFWNHYIAFIPAAAEGFVRVVPAVREAVARRIVRLVLVAWVFFWPIRQQVYSWHYLAAETPSMQAGAKEISQAFERNPGKNVEMALGQDYMAESDLLLLLQPVLAFRNQPISFISSLDMESVFNRVPMPSSRLRGIEDCRTIWLVPHGEDPFAMRGPFGLPAVWPEARTSFKNGKTALASGAIFDLWGCGS